MKKMLIFTEGCVATYEDIQKIFSKQPIIDFICDYIRDENLTYSVKPTKDFCCKIDDYFYIRQKDAEKINIIATPIGRGLGNGVCVNVAGRIICGNFDRDTVHKITFYGHFCKPTSQLYGYLFNDGLYVSENLSKIQTKEIKKLFHENVNCFCGVFATNSTLTLLKPEEGTYQLSNNTTYKGSLLNGQFHGRGKIIDLFDGTFEGTFEKGKKEGFGISINPNGKEERGVWKKGNKIGKFTIKHPDGTKEIVEYQTPKSK